MDGLLIEYGQQINIRQLIEDILIEGKRYLAINVRMGINSYAYSIFEPVEKIIIYSDDSIELIISTEDEQTKSFLNDNKITITSRWTIRINPFGDGGYFLISPFEEVFLLVTSTECKDMIERTEELMMYKELFNDLQVGTWSINLKIAIKGK